MKSESLLQMSSTQAKQAFGKLLEAAAHGPVAIEKHHKVKAIVASPEFFADAERRHAQGTERHAARAQQVLLERERLLKHHRIALTLLTSPKPARDALLKSARLAVDRWQAEGLCSQDYIEKWRAMLNLPISELALAMTSDAEGWGPALRQNSPWAGAMR